MPDTGDYVTTGVPGMDRVMRGGLPRDRITLIRGPYGCGKTTMALQFLAEGARFGDKCLFISTAEPEKEIRFIARSHGIDLNDITLRHYASEKHIVEQTMVHPAEVELPGMIEAIVSMVDEIGPARLVIDSLVELRLLARDDRWYRQQLLILRSQLAERRCTVLLADVSVEPRHSVLNTIVSAAIFAEERTPSYGGTRWRLRIDKLVGKAFFSGYHDYRIVTGGVRIYPRLVAAEYRQETGLKVASTGNEELDSMLGGGLDRGSSTLLLGPSGTGKSSLIIQCVHAAAERGESSLVYIFDERPHTFFKRAANLGLDLEPYVGKGLVSVRKLDPAELSPGEFSEIVRARIESNGVRYVAIDSLNGYAFAMPDERYLTVHIHELSNFLNLQDVSTLYTMAQSSVATGQSTTPLEVSYISDTVVLCRHFEYEGAVRKAISVHKRRTGAHESTLRELTLGPDGLTVGRPLKEFRGILGGAPELLANNRDTPID